MIGEVETWSKGELTIWISGLLLLWYLASLEMVTVGDLMVYFGLLEAKMRTLVPSVVTATL